MIITTITHIAESWREGGWLLIPIALTAFGIWAYGLRLLMMLRLALENASALEKQLETASDSDPAALSPADVQSGIMKTIPGNNGTERRDALERMALAFISRVRQDFMVLKALTAAAPLLGLLGTVTGMVATFAAVSRYGDDGAAPIADGIRSALLTTQFGLVAALPGVFGLSHLNNLLLRLRSSLDASGILLQRSADARRPDHV